MVDVSNIFYPTLTLPLARGGNWIFIVSPLYKGRAVSRIIKQEIKRVKLT
jgi:hypothetical protein